MSLDIEQLRAKLGQLSNRARISDILWKPQEGPNVVRILPLASNPENPFIEAYFHYLGGKTYLSPLTFGEPDPIEEFAQQVRAQGGLSKEEWNETKKFMPKLRTYVPVVVRGKESDGVRFWGFGKTVYTELLGVIADPDYGDITDPQSGRDVKVEFTPSEKSSTGFPDTKIRMVPNVSPLTDDAKLKDKLLTVQPDLFEYYDRPSYDDLKNVLERFLAPKNETPREVSSADGWGSEEPGTEAPAEAVEEAPASKDIDAEFKAMFESE